MGIFTALTGVSNVSHTQHSKCGIVYCFYITSIRRKGMHGDAALKSFSRCKYKAEMMIFKLVSQLRPCITHEELMAETQERWVHCFDFYETDNQYLRFMFIVMKNRIKNMKVNYQRYSRRHLSDTNLISSKFSLLLAEDGGHIRVMNEIAVDDGKRECNPATQAEQKDLIETIIRRLPRELYKNIFIRLVEGMSIKDIASELGFTTCYIGCVKNKHIWPVVKEVMEISDEKYNRLIDSGRVYCF